MRHSYCSWESSRERWNKKKRRKKLWNSCKEFFIILKWWEGKKRRDFHCLLCKNGALMCGWVRKNACNVMQIFKRNVFFHLISSMSHAITWHRMSRLFKSFKFHFSTESISTLCQECYFLSLFLFRELRNKLFTVNWLRFNHFCCFFDCPIHFCGSVFCSKWENKKIRSFFFSISPKLVE